MNDDRMYGPGAHEAAATEALRNGEIQEAQVRAILALASAVNRLAVAQASIAYPDRLDSGGPDTPNEPHISSPSTEPAAQFRAHADAILRAEGVHLDGGDFD